MANVSLYIWQEDHIQYKYVEKFWHVQLRIADAPVSNFIHAISPVLADSENDSNYCRFRSPVYFRLGESSRGMIKAYCTLEPE